MSLDALILPTRFKKAVSVIEARAKGGVFTILDK